jgi:hypothetical protein
MRKAVGLGLSTAAGLTPTAAWAAKTSPAASGAPGPGDPDTTGTITATPAAIMLSGAPPAVVTGTAGVGNDPASWGPALVMAVPAPDAGGGYAGMLAPSVS